MTDKLEEVVISFLNTDGGNIFIGVNDDNKYIQHIGYGCEENLLLIAAKSYLRLTITLKNDIISV